MSSLFGSAWASARSKLWPLPVVGVVLAVVAGVLLPQLDARLGSYLPPWSAAALFGGDAGAARTLLDAISSSLITVTSLTFSLTVVTLQLASSQFSPRLLRTFTSDVFVQGTLAIFLSTFTFALTVLRAVRSRDDDTVEFVPRISVTVAFALGIVSVLFLVFFLAHLARQIRVETMLRDVHDDANATVLRTTGSSDDAGPEPTMPTAPSHAVVILASSSGFLTSIDEPRLLSAATKANACLVVERAPGASLIEGVPIGTAWSTTEGFADGELDRLRDAIDTAIGVGFERTSAQDVGYGLRQLSDVANKALSPGINDPTTAVHALGHISAILCQLASRDLRPVVLRDDDDRIRVVLHRPGFGEVLDAAITQPRRYGASDPQVMERLFGLLEELAWHVADAAVVRDQLRRLRNTVAGADFDDVETARLERAAARVEEALARQSPLPPI